MLLAQLPHEENRHDNLPHSYPQQVPIPTTQNSLQTNLMDIALYPNTMIINGRPRHPRSQGLLEKGNDILETKLSAWLEDNKRDG